MVKLNGDTPCHPCLGIDDDRGEGAEMFVSGGGVNIMIRGEIFSRDRISSRRFDHVFRNVFSLLMGGEREGYIFLAFCSNEYDVPLVGGIR